MIIWYCFHPAALLIDKIMKYLAWKTEPTSIDINMGSILDYRIIPVMIRKDPNIFSLNLVDHG